MNIGETFGRELFAAGCNDGVSFTIGDTEESITFNPDVTPAQRAKVAAVVAAHDPAKPDQTPDPLGFIQACKAAAGGIVPANALAVAYPLFFAAVQSQAWPDVQALIIDARTKGVLSSAQYAAFQAAAVLHKIPATLP